MAYPSFFPPLHLHTWVLSWKLEPQFCRAKSIPSREMSPQHLGLIYLNSFTHSFNKLSLGSCILDLGLALTWSQTSNSSPFGGRDTR